MNATPNFQRAGNANGRINGAANGRINGAANGRINGAANGRINGANGANRGGPNNGANGANRGGPNNGANRAGNANLKTQAEKLRNFLKNRLPQNLFKEGNISMKNGKYNSALNSYRQTKKKYWNRKLGTITINNAARIGNNRRNNTNAAASRAASNALRKLANALINRPLA